MAKQVMCHPALGSFHINEDGYPRLNQKPHRRQYLHRVVVEEFWKAHGGHPIYGDKIPDGMTVNHQDGNKLHWCIENLLVVSHSINAHLRAITQKRNGNGVFDSEDDVPEWVTQDV